MRLKHFLSVFLTLLTLSVGQMWGAGSYSLSGSQFGNSNVSNYSTSEATLTGSNSSSWKVKGYGVVANTSLSIGKGGANYLKTPVCPENITSIVVTWSGNTSYYLALQTTNGTELEAKSNPSTATAATFTVTGSYTQLQLVGRRSSGTSNAEAKITSVTVNYGSSCNSLTMSTVTATPGNARIDLSWPTVANASSYTVTCKNGNANAGSIGNVTSNGTTRTCVISNLTNGTEYTWSVMPVGDGSSYCEDNTPATGDATPNVSRTITYYDKDGQHTTSLVEGTNIATALNALYGVSGPTSCNTTDYNYFAGWKDGEISGTASSVTLLSTEVVNATNAEKTFYAVWSDKNPSSGSWTQTTSVAVGDHVVIAQIDDGTKEMTGFNTTITTANNFGTGAAFTTSPAGTMIWTVEAGNSEGSFAFKNSNNYYLNLPSDNNYLNGSTTKNNCSSWTIQTSSSRAAVTNVQYTTRKLMWNKANTRFSTYAGKSHGNNSGQYYYYVIFYKQAAVSANYITTCCSPLGSINGSFNETHPTSVVLMWDKNENYENWAVTGSGTIGKIGTTTISDVDYCTCEVTGLSCNTEYEFTVTADPVENSGYCDGSWKISGTTGKYSISVADGITNGTIVADKTTACAGETVTLTVTPSSEVNGYHLASWSLNGTAQDVNTLTFTMPEGNATISGAFEANNVPMVINITSTDKATVTSSVPSAFANTNITLSCTDIAEGYQFFGWTVTAGGNSVEVTNPTSATGASFTMPAAVVTVTADIRQMVTVTFKRNNETCANQSTYVGGTVTFPETDPIGLEGYPNFIGWAEAIEGIATSAPTLKSASDAITENVEYHAVFANAPQPVNSYEKVTTTGDLANNCKYVIAAWDAAESKYYAATGSLTSNGYYLDKENITSKVSNNIVTAPANSEVWKATVANSKVQFQNVGNSKYMSAVVNNTYTNFTLTDNSGEEYTYSVSTGAWTFTTSSLSNNKQIEYYDDSGKDYFSYYTAQDAPIYLFKQQSAYTEWVTRTIVKYTISYNANTTDPYTGTLPGSEKVIDGEDYTVSTAELGGRDGYNFVGWNTDNTATTAQTTIVNVTANATLYAVWEKIPTYDIEFSVNGAKVEALKLADQLEGTAIVFPDAAAITAASAFPTTDKKFVGWIEASSYASDVAPSFVTSATVENAGKTYYAVFADVTEGDYEKLTSATGLAAGDKLVATDGGAVGMKAWDGEKNNCQGATITIANNKITTLGDAAELILGGESGHWTLYDGEYYLYAAGTSTSGTNYMKGKEQKDNACEWTISISSGDATIRSVTNSQTPYMRYNPNNGNPIFSCYSSSSSQNAVVLFKKAVTVADFVTTVAPLDHIAISGDFQTTYKKGTTLNLEGMVVTATYGTGGDARNRVLASDAYTVDLVGEELATTDDEFVVSFGGKTATQAIHVYALSGIEITSAPTKTTYKAGETFVPEGLKIQATWGGDATDKIEESNIATGFTYSPTTAFENETDENINVDVTITYEDAEVAQSATLQVIVEPLAHLVMTWNVAGETTTSKIYINGDEQYLLALPDDPEVPEAFGTGYEFIGWTNAGSVERDGSDFTKAVAGVEIDKNATEAERTYHAVFAQVNAPFFKETFDNCDGTGGNDGSWSGNIASNAFNADNTWSSVKCYGGDQCARIGSSSTQGSATTPTFSMTGSGKLVFKAGAFEGDQTTMNLSATGATLASSSVTLKNAAWDDYEIAITNATGSVTITFQGKQASGARFFLDEVEVKNGDAEYSNYRFMPSSVTTPVIGLAEATYYGAQNATITQAQEKQIFYSLDGNTWTEYTEPVALNQASVTLYAKAYDESEDDYSSVVSKSYTIITEIEDPTITPSKAFYGGSMEVEISHELSGTEGFTLQYSYDGENYVDYTTALTITEDKTVYAKATIGSLEAIVNANYTVGRSITYWRVTNANQLRAGQRAIIAQYVSADETVTVKVMDAQSGNNCNAKASTATNNGAIITPAFVAYSITLEDAGDGMFAFKVPGGYLYAASSSSNHLKLRETNDNADGKWKIEISNTAVATITAQGDATHNLLKYNSSSDLFSCYQSGQTAVAIYVNEICTDINVSALEDNADVTVGKDATLTIDEEKTLNDIIVNSGATVTVNERLEANDVTVKDGGVLNIAENKTAEVTNLYIKAKAGASGQVTGAEQVEADGLFMDITLFTSAEGLIDADYWYSVAVPFDVDLNSGVFQADGSPMTNRVDFEVWGYNTTLRAQTQSNGWQRVSDNMMHAGKAYLIGFNPGQPNIIRLKATANWKEHLFSGTSMSVVSTSTGTVHDNWNGLANPTMRYIDVNKKTEVFNNNTHEWDSYDPEALSFNFVVGTAFFVQSDEAVTISNTDHGNYRAPKRVDETKCAYAVRITREDAKDFDNQIIVRASEDATGEYTQGHDMLTMNGTSSNTAALLWTENYGGKRLAIEEAAWLNGTATYELKMYAPKAGSYSISVAETKDNADLYLTYEGSIIWNISESEYTVDLGKGKTDGYGLLLQAKAPSVATGVDNVQGDNVQCTKVVIDEHVFILRGGQMYDVTGKMVK